MDEANFEQISRSWIDEWLLGKIIAGTLRDLGLDNGTAWWAVTTIKILTSHQRWFEMQTVEKKERVYRVLESWLKDDEVQQFLQVNRYQDVLWFNKEAFEQLLWWMLLLAVVKSNAYGHGIEEVARLAAGSGADALGVHTVEEAEQIARMGLGRPVLILGYVGPAQAERAVAAGAEVTVYNPETIEALSVAAVAAGRTVGCHVKLETGVSRQGIMPDDLEEFLDACTRLPGLSLAGVSTHFANIE